VSVCVLIPLTDRPSGQLRAQKLRRTKATYRQRFAPIERP
jgi:hypothetical protein